MSVLSRIISVVVGLLLPAIVLAPCSSAGQEEVREAKDDQPRLQTALENLRSTVQGWIDGGRLVGGELLVMNGGEVVLHEGFGWKDRERKEVMTQNTLFNIRSMTKPLVGAAAQILMAEGGCARGDPVARYLPSFDSDATREITVGQLLTHTSGLPAGVAWNPQSPPSSLQAHAAAIAETGPELDPGARFWYTDAGADVLGALVESVSSQSLEAFLEERIFGPLGMEDTGFLTATSEHPLPLERVAALYGGSTGNWQRFWSGEDSPFYPFPMGSQSVYSTPADYARFLGMWMGGGALEEERVLPEEAVERALTPLSPMTLIGSPAPFPTGFSGLEVWHGEMAMIWRPPEGGNGVTPDESTAVGYLGSDGTFAWAWPGTGRMVLFFTQSRGQDVHLELEALLNRLFLEG